MNNTELHQSRILIVDDNAANVEQLEQLLEFNDFTDLKSTTDPRAVEALLKEYRPDLILLDLQMPHLDGFQILEMLGRKVPEADFLPVIVLTADVSTESRERALKLGAMDFLTKPFDFVEAVLRVTNQLRTRRLHQQLQGYSEQLEDKVRERTVELKRAQDELVAQERYKAMGQMASGIAHDFNNTVAVMMGNAELLITFPDLLKDAEETNKALKTIYLASQDAASIVRRLREFYKSDDQEEQEETADLRDAGEEAVSLTEPKWKGQAQSSGRNIHLKTELESVTVRMSPSKVREILTNFVFNAVDAMPEGGVITLRSRAEDGYGVLEVADSGTGMSEEVRQKCLNMFFCTKGSKGTGLGLGMVNDMVQKHRGRIDIESEPGKGSTFLVRLPLADAAAKDGTDADHRLDRRLKILLVDDEENLLDIYSQLLSLDGHTVVTAVDGREGLVQYLADDFDLVITDQAMPGVNGAHLVRSIRRHSGEIPIVMLTGFSDSLKSEVGVPEGITRLIAKPVGIVHLRTAIFEIFSGSGPT